MQQVLLHFVWWCFFFLKQVLSVCYRQEESFFRSVYISFHGGSLFLVVSNSFNSGWFLDQLTAAWLWEIIAVQTHHFCLPAVGRSSILDIVSVVQFRVVKASIRRSTWSSPLDFFNNWLKKKKIYLPCQVCENICPAKLLKTAATVAETRMQCFSALD